MRTLRSFQKNGWRAIRIMKRQVWSCYLSARLFQGKNQTHAACQVDAKWRRDNNWQNKAANFFLLPEDETDIGNILSLYANTKDKPKLWLPQEEVERVVDPRSPLLSPLLFFLAQRKAGMECISSFHQFFNLSLRFIGRVKSFAGLN